MRAFWRFGRRSGPAPLLVLGANSYLGQNIAVECAKADVWFASASRPNPIVQRVVSADRFVRTDHSSRFRGLPLAEAMIVLARPRSQDYAKTRSFYDALEAMILAQIADGALKRVIFASTQLVYRESSRKINVAAARTFVPAPYEYFKLRFELMLQHLVDAAKLESAVVLRLPLLAGGEILVPQRLQQYLYMAYDAYCRGGEWSFQSVEDSAFGTSWAFTPDLAARIIRPWPIGYLVQNCASGFVTYRSLHDAWRFTQRDSESKPLHLMRSRFELSNDLDLPVRDLMQAMCAVPLEKSSDARRPRV